MIGTLSYSDPETGSHFWYPISSKAERSNGGYRVTKKASWTTSGGFADFYVVQTTSPDFKGYDDLSVFVDRQGALRGAALALGRARPPRQPVGRDRVQRRRDPRHADRRAGGGRRDVERRGRRPVVPHRLVVGVERARARRDRHREAPHDPQEARRRRHARRRLPDDPGLRRPGRDGDERVAACSCYSVAQAFDGATENNTVVLEPGVLARGNFLHWAWQIKFVAAQNTATVVDKMLHACGGSGYKRDMELERYVRDAQGRLGDGADERGAAAVRRQGRAARLRVARLLEPVVQPARGRERGQEARRRRQAGARRAAASPRPRPRRRRNRRRRSRSTSRGRPPPARACSSRGSFRATPDASAIACGAGGDGDPARAGRPAHGPRPRRRPARRGHRPRLRHGRLRRARRRAGRRRDASFASLVGSAEDGAAEIVDGRRGTRRRPDAGHGGRALRAVDAAGRGDDASRGAAAPRRRRRARRGRGRSSRAARPRPTSSSRSPARDRSTSSSRGSRSRSPTRGSTSRSTAPRRSPTR